MQTRHLDRQELEKEYPHLKDFLPFLDTHNAESSRGKVLVACSYLEEQLRTIIEGFLVEGSDAAVLLEGFNAPLGTLSARTKAAHALGLLSDIERDDCDTLRKIRNEFAHSHLASFDDAKIIGLCARLHHAAPDYGEVILSPENKFGSAAIGLVLSLTNRAHYVSQKRLQRDQWPA